MFNILRYNEHFEPRDAPTPSLSMLDPLSKFCVEVGFRRLFHAHDAPAHHVQHWKRGGRGRINASSRGLELLPQVLKKSYRNKNLNPSVANRIMGRCQTLKLRVFLRWCHDSTAHFSPTTHTTHTTRIFVQNRRFSKEKWAAKSRMFVQNRRFSKKKWAANLQRTSYWKSDDFVDFQIRSGFF